MQTTISYNVPPEEMDSILAMLGYTEGDKYEFLNSAIERVVVSAISDVFINIRQKEAQERTAKIPEMVWTQVKSMLTINTWE